MLQPYKVFYLFTGAGHPPLQAGFGASSRVFKKATDRNRIKRLTREAYRVQKMELLGLLRIQANPMAVFFIYTGREIPEAQLLKGKMELILQRLIHLANEKAALHS